MEELLEYLFPKEMLEEHFGRELMYDEWFAKAKTLAFNLEVGLDRKYFNDSYSDMMSEL